MCLILFAWQAHPRFPLIVAANRDEFHNRPTEAAHWWAEADGVLAGRDLQAGGTWMGVSRDGRFAAVTNYREPPEPELPLERSRGQLVRDYLTGDNPAAEFAWRLGSSSNRYQGFCLLLSDHEDLVCASNRMEEPVPVSPGVHALSNHLMDTAWPKAQHGRLRLQTLLKSDRVDAESLLGIMADRSLVPGEEPAEFDLRLAPERLTRISFVVSPEYGTRSSTVLLVDRESGVEYVERRFDPTGKAVDTGRFVFSIG